MVARSTKQCRWGWCTLSYWPGQGCSFSIFEEDHRFFVGGSWTNKVLRKDHSLFLGGDLKSAGYFRGHGKGFQFIRCIVRLLQMLEKRCLVFHSFILRWYLKLSLCAFSAKSFLSSPSTFFQRLETMRASFPNPTCALGTEFVLESSLPFLAAFLCWIRFLCIKMLYAFSGLQELNVTMNEYLKWLMLAVTR